MNGMMRCGLPWWSPFGKICVCTCGEVADKVLRSAFKHFL